MFLTQYLYLTNSFYNKHGLYAHTQVCSRYVHVPQRYIELCTYQHTSQLSTYFRSLMSAPLFIALPKYINFCHNFPSRRLYFLGFFLVLLCQYTSPRVDLCMPEIKIYLAVSGLYRFGVIHNCLHFSYILVLQLKFLWWFCPIFTI